LHAAVHIALLAHQGAQGGDFASVAAVEWREGGDLGDCLGSMGIAHGAILGAGLTRHVYASQINYTSNKTVKTL
jgi:hypothetical protein